MNRRGITCQLVWFAVLAVTIICMGGCGKNDRPKTIPISGRVTIDGQPPGEYGKLFFTPTQAASGYDKRPASGTFTPEGKYRVMSWEADDGLVPGHYTVNILPNEPTKVPTKYRESNTSGLEVDVPVDQGQIEYNIDVRTE